MHPISKEVFEQLPSHFKPLAESLRTLIFATAKELAAGQVEESLKWGQLSFVVKGGSPIRLGVSSKHSDHYCLFFHCQTSLVATFRELYGNQLCFEGNRAIVFKYGERVPEQAVRHCLSLALRYKSIKHLPLLGA